MLTNTYQRTIILVPHFDDEVFILAPLILDKERFQNPLFVFITSDDGERFPESIAFLKKFGFKQEDFLFIGRDLKVSDGSVVKRISEISSNLISLLKDENGLLILTTAWEGGHPDHDAVALIANLISEKINAQSLEYWTYNGQDTKGHFFNFMRPIYDSDMVLNYKIPLHLYIKIFYSIRVYKSQWKTWVGFLPALLLKIFYRREIKLTAPKKSFQLMRPHDGPLLYERYRRTTFDVFLSNLK